MPEILTTEAAYCTIRRNSVLRINTASGGHDTVYYIFLSIAKHLMLVLSVGACIVVLMF